MTTNHQKFSLVFLILTTSLAFLLTLIFLLLSLFKRQVGFLTQNSSAFICSVYLTFKLSTNRVNILNASFSGGVCGLLMEALTLFQLLYRLIKTFRTDRGEVKFSSEEVRRFYVYYSFGLLGTLVGTGYYLTYIVQYGVKCLDDVLSDWIIFFIFISLSFICLLISWIYILYMISTERQSENDPDVSVVTFKAEKYQQGKVEDDRMYRQMEESDRHSKDYHSQTVSNHHQMSILSEKEYPTYMAYLLDQIKKQKQNQPPPELRKPLIEEVSSEDRCSEKGALEKINPMSYEEYRKKMQQTSELKQQLQEDVIQEESQDFENKWQRKSPAIMALLPFSNKFYRDIDDLDDGRKIKPDKSKEPQQFYPANFVPSNEHERKKFQAYKKKLLKKAKKENSNGKLKHPQNIEGGRSKRSLKRYFQQSKRPIRNPASFWESTKNSSIVYPPISEREKFASKDSQSSDQSSESSSKNQVPDKKEDQIPVVEIKPPPRPIQIEQSIEREVEPQKLHFYKAKTPNRQRKILFSPTYTDITMEEALSTLVKGIEQNEMKNKLRQIRDRRNSNISSFRGKKGQRLIEAIRSTYQ